MIQSYSTNSDFAKKADVVYKSLVDSLNKISDLSLFDFKQLSDLNKSLPSSLDADEENQLALFLSDIEDRVTKNDNENVKNKSLINKFLSEFTFQIENTQQNRFTANELNVLKSNQIDFKKNLTTLLNKNTENLHDIKLLIKEFKYKTGIKGQDYQRVEELVKLVLNNEFQNYRNSILEEVKTILSNSKKLVMDNDCQLILSKNKSDLVYLKDNVSQEIAFIKNEITKIKNETSKFVDVFKDKTDFLEEYLENAHSELNRKYDSITPILKSKIKY